MRTIIGGLKLAAIMGWLLWSTGSMAEEKIATLVMFGDSTTLCSDDLPEAKLTTLVERYLTQTQHLQVVVVNSGKGSDTAKGGYARLAEAVLKHNPDVVTISFGLNDTVLLTPGEYREWMGKIIQDICGKSHAKIVLVTSTPFNNARHAGEARFSAQGGLDEYMDANICRQVRELAREHDLALCDLHEYFREKFKTDPVLIDRLIRPDGVHLTEEGNRVAAGHLAPEIARLISQANSVAKK